MKRGKQSRTGKSSPKHSLSLPDLDQARSAVLNSLPSKESQRGYRHAIDEFVAWYCSEPRLSSNKPLLPAIDFTWNRVSLRRARSTAGSRPSGASHTRPLIPACAARISPPASGESKDQGISTSV